MAHDKKRALVRGVAMLPHAGSQTLCPNRAAELGHPAAGLRCRGFGQGQGTPRARPRELQKPSENVRETLEIFEKLSKTVRNLGELSGIVWNFGNCNINFERTLV